MITVLGSGSWGTALAQVLAQNNLNVTLWGRSLTLRPHCHPDIDLASNISFESDFDTALQDSDAIIYALPSYVARDYFPRIKPFLHTNTILVTSSKGIENESLQTLNEIAGDILGQDFAENHYAVLSGPSFAHDVIRNYPTAVTAASKSEPTAQKVQRIFHLPTFHVFTSTDTLGVELAGALKNVIAIAAGACDGFKFGASARSALITRGLAEIIRIGEKKGAKPITFSGLSGLGDLILTCTTDLSRNRRVGLKFAEGKSLKEVLKEIGQVAEGIRTTKSAYEMSKQLNVNTPIIDEMYKAIFENKAPKKAIEDILNQTPSAE